MNRFTTQLCIVIALGSMAGPRQAHATVRAVALSGELAPGTLGEVRYDGFGFSPPALNDSGQTAFFANLTGDAVNETNNQGIWSERSGVPTLVIRTGSPAPGTPSGVNFSSLGPPTLNDSGQTAFFAFADRQGIWSERSGSLGLVARGGDPAAGTAGVFNPINYGEFGSLSFNNDGHTAFSARLTSVSGPLSIPGNDKANWSDRSGTTALAVRAGNQIPDAPAGVRFGYALTSLGSTDELRPVLNNAGQIAFLTRLVGTGVTNSNNRGIWSEGSGTLAMVARSGNQAPGTPSGVNFSSFGGFAFVPPALNDAGKSAFFANLVGTGVDATNNGGIWSEGSGSLALVARSGDQAPGTTSGVKFSSLGWRVVLNNGGKTAFGAQLIGTSVDETNSTGIWSEGFGSLALVARTGDDSPGISGSVTFSGFSDITLNDAGQAAFSAQLTGSGVDGSNNQGIWATDPSGALQLIARAGNLLEVAPGDSRTIQQLSFASGTGNSDGYLSGFNNRGQLAFRASFTDGSSGIFVSDRVAVPEPGTFALTITGLCAAAVLHRKRRAACDASL